MKVLVFLLIFSFNSQAKLVDKIAGVINDSVFTLSEIERINTTIDVRKEIAPFIYTKAKYNKQDLLILMQNLYIVKDKLSELGFVVSDDSVEDRIRETEKGLRLSRDELLAFLDSKSITFNEYFEIIRTAIEFNIFNRNIIAPLVTITDQELKERYFENDAKAKSSAFIYNLIDFSIAKSKLQASDIKRLPAILKDYRQSGNLPEIYSSISTDEIGNISDEDLQKDLKGLLRKTKVDSFSEPFILDDTIHVYFVAKKEISESQDFLNKKRFIYNDLFLERAVLLSENWFSRESLNYYIVNNL